LGIEVTDDGWVIEAAPVTGWTIGRRGWEVAAAYCRRCGGPVSWQQVPSRLHYAGHSLTGSTAELHAAVDALNANTVPESHYQKVLASRAGHSRGTWPQSAAVPNGHKRISGAQVSHQMM
jgi:hypothetical protein